MVHTQSPFLTMFCRRRRHLNGGNGKDVVRAISDGIRHVREMARHVKRFDAQAHKYSSKIVGSIAASGSGGRAVAAAPRRQHQQAVDMQMQVQYLNTGLRSDG